MRILVFGSMGQLGKALSDRDGGEFTIRGVDIKDGDITEMEQVRDLIDSRSPEIVINASAYTDVDKAEKDEARAFAVNHDGPANMAEVCRDKDIPFIHVSTDFVFDGKNDIPYKETDPVNPLSVYAVTKEAGERAVRKILPRHLIIRTAWLYSHTGRNFVHTMLRLGREKKELGVVADQKGCPTAAGDLAEAILTIAGTIRKKKDVKWGTYHYCGKGRATWHDFAQAIFQTAQGLGYSHCPHVKAITTDEYPVPAPRPAFSVLDCGKSRENFGIETSPWQMSLEKVIRRILQGKE